MHCATPSDYPDRRAGEDGEYRQLSDHLLQIENVYSTVRPKRNSQAGETPLRTLWERGVEYVEVRCLDLNPYLPLGIDETQIRFLDTFLILCLLRDSPATNCEEYRHINTNQALLVYEGRDPKLKLHTLDGERRRATGGRTVRPAGAVAELIDSARVSAPRCRGCFPAAPDRCRPHAIGAGHQT